MIAICVCPSIIVNVHDELIADGCVNVRAIQYVDMVNKVKESICNQRIVIVVKVNVFNVLNIFVIYTFLMLGK
jgi:hypothetical protein